MKVARITSIALSLILSACVMPPRTRPPQQMLTDDHIGLSSQPPAPVAETAWWHAFNDPQLDRLMEQTLANNPTLAQAMARVSEAHAMAGVVKAGLYPSVSLNAQETRQRFSGRDIIPHPFAGTNQWEGHEGLDLSWDLDFWGRQSSLLKQARSQTAVAALDVESARLALSGAVTHAYVDLYRDNALADLARRTEAQRQRILDITRRRVQDGIDTNVELREAAGAVPQAHVEFSQTQTAVAIDTHQLAALSGQGADVYAQIHRPELDPDASISLPSALPVNLLGRRPDVLAARDRIEAATAGKAAAKAAFYPDINLVAFAGTAAVGFNNLFQSASGRYGAGPAIHLPLFDAGRLRSEYRGAIAEIDAAVAGYNEVVLRAVRDTSDQLSLLQNLTTEIVEQQQSLDDAEAAYKLAAERYRSGVASYLTVLNAETSVLSARREHIQLISAQTTARIDLLLAVGGSFDPSLPLPL